MLEFSSQHASDRLLASDLAVPSQALVTLRVISHLPRLRNIASRCSSEFILLHLRYSVLHLRS